MRQLKISSTITTRNSVLDKYLHDVNQYPLLSLDEEVSLARTIRAGGEAAAAAHDKLVCSNLRFVITVAKQYQSSGIPLTDLINEGNMGLIKAADKFDDTLGFRFISYAVWWIRQAITRAIGDQSRDVRLPANVSNELGKIAKFRTEYEQKHHHLPSVDEIAEFVGLSAGKVNQLLAASVHELSLDAPFEEGEANSLLDVVEDSNAPMADDGLISESLTTDVDKALESLNSREAQILRLFFGIGGTEMTMEEIGMRFDMSRERVRQIKERALRRLRTNCAAFLAPHFC